MIWDVCRGKLWIGISEINYAWASAYWPRRGFVLVRRKSSARSVVK